MYESDAPRQYIILDDYEKLSASRIDTCITLLDPGINPRGRSSVCRRLMSHQPRTNQHFEYACLDMTEVAEGSRLSLEHLEPYYQKRKPSRWLRRRRISYRSWHAIFYTHIVRLIDCDFDRQVLGVYPSL